MSAPIVTLGDALPLEVQRCQELIKHYEALGPVGTFGKAMIQNEIDMALAAMVSGDVAEMLHYYEALKGCQ